MPQKLALTANGRFVAFCQEDGVHVVDTMGPAPRRVLPIRAQAIACLGTDLFLSDGKTMSRLALGTDEVPVRLADVMATRIVPVSRDTLVVETSDGTMIVERGGVSPSGLDTARVLCASGRRVIVATDRGAELRTLGGRTAAGLPVRDHVAMAAAWVMGERAIAVWLRGLDADALLVCTGKGEQIRRTVVPVLRACAFAADATRAIALAGDELITIDLRLGHLIGRSRVPDVIDIAVDSSARHVVLASAAGITRVGHEELVRAATPPLPVEAGVEPEPVIVIDEPAVSDEPASTERSERTDRSEPLPDLIPHALAPAPVPPIAIDAGAARPYANGGEHLAALLDVVAARTALAIAEAWHSGRTSHDVEDGLPCEREVLGLLGEDVGLAADALRRARERLAEKADQLRDRTAASLVADVRLPFHELARSYHLSSVATQILACASAPRLRTSIARLYGVLAGISGRIACVDHVLESLVETPGDSSIAIARELAPDAPLVRTGLVIVQARADRTDLIVDSVVLDRLRGIERAVEISEATTRRAAAVMLEDVVAPFQIKRALLVGLADLDPARPARVVVRGRRGSGRHTIIGALAQRVGRDVAEVDVARLPRNGLAAALALELQRAELSSCVPIVSGLENLPKDDQELVRHVGSVLRRHAGPLVIRAAPDVELPLQPERIDVTLPPLSLRQRSDVWGAMLAGRALAVPDADTLAMLAARYRFGAGTIARIADEVARRTDRNGAAIEVLVEEVARNHLAGRLERVATRITRLPDWDQVTLIDEMRDSVRELVGRMRYQRTVFEEWGFDRRISTARGLTALFYGPPGTGKTLVAGLIGRELGLDVWRIDLAQIMSKWVGETEKNLAEVFEAAEEGQVMLLFDEADSLFGKRSEVKSSNDRYANLETNYLLQRFDSFEGVAILTTNLEGSIDPAFKRRLSMRMYVPFPDEDLREKLWAAHIPATVPRAGELDFASLARRYPLSGGYIRNSALRAAFLAAQEQRPLANDHLVRAVQLEYYELGKLSSSGRID
jgi:hypothetical protein